MNAQCSESAYRDTMVGQLTEPNRKCWCLLQETAHSFISGYFFVSFGIIMSVKKKRKENASKLIASDDNCLFCSFVCTLLASVIAKPKIPLAAINIISYCCSNVCYFPFC